MIEANEGATRVPRLPHKQVARWGITSTTTSVAHTSGSRRTCQGDMRTNTGHIQQTGKIRSDQGGHQLQNLAKACGSGQPTFTLFSYTNTHLSLLKKIPGKPKTMHASMHGWVHVCVLEKPNNQTCKHSRTVMSLMQMAGVILVKAHYAVFEFFARRLLALSPSSYRLELWICLYVCIYTPPLEHLQRSCKRGSRSS
jgi:hypothetical protein